MVELVISLVALIASFLTFAVNLRFSSQAERRARLPLVVGYREGPNLIISNVGAAAAINIYVYEAADHYEHNVDSLPETASSEWQELEHCRPLRGGQEYTLALKYAKQSALAIGYTDAFGYPYKLLMSKGGSLLIEPRASRFHLPGAKWKVSGSRSF